LSTSFVLRLRPSALFNEMNYFIKKNAQYEPPIIL
jgi:hypothetical protein